MSKLANYLQIASSKKVQCIPLHGCFNFERWIIFIFTNSRSNAGCRIKLCTSPIWPRFLIPKLSSSKNLNIYCALRQKYICSPTLFKLLLFILFNIPSALGMSNFGPRGLLSGRVSLQPGSNTPEQASQELPNYYKATDRWVCLRVGAKLLSTVTEVAHPCSTWTTGVQFCSWKVIVLQCLSPTPIKTRLNQVMKVLRPVHTKDDDDKDKDMVNLFQY